jgi:hypothetical protein
MLQHVSGFRRHDNMDVDVHSAFNMLDFYVDKTHQRRICRLIENTDGSSGLY